MTCLRFFLIAVVLLLGAAVYTSAADRDFDGLVSDVAQHYDAQPIRIPMMSIVSLCARAATHGGVRSLRIAEFDHLKAALDDTELISLVRENLGPEWQPFINERGQHGDSQSDIFVRPEGDAMRMLIAEYDHGELDLVRMELNGETLAKWTKDPQGEAHHQH